MKDAVIIGAGISGLAAAFTLKQRGFDIVVLETAARAGGVVTTVRQDGFILDLGPNSTPEKPRLSKLIEALDLRSSVLYVPDSVKNRFLVCPAGPSREPRLVAAPLSLLAAARTPIISTRAKCRAFGEPFVAKASAEDEDVRTFMTRRLGQELTDEVVSPVLSGIWASDISKLSCRCALPKLWQMEQESGSLIGGALHMLRQKRSEPRTPRARIISFRSGLGELTERLSHLLAPDQILTRSPMKGLERIEGGMRIHYDGQHVDARRVVFASPASVTAELTQDLFPELSAAVRSVPYAPIGVMHLACRRASVRHPLDGYGFLWKPEKGRALLGTLFSSSMFTNRAPDGNVLLTALCGGAVNPELSDIEDSRLQREVFDHLRKLLGMDADPQVLKTTYWQRAIPNYAVGHHHLLDLLGRLESQHPEFRFIGNWRLGISIADCVDFAVRTAESLGEPDRIGASY